MRAGGGGGGGEDSIISLKAAGHLGSSNVAVHLDVVRADWHWSMAFEAWGKSPDQYTAETARWLPRSLLWALARFLSICLQR